MIKTIIFYWNYKVCFFFYFGVFFLGGGWNWSTPAFRKKPTANSVYLLLKKYIYMSNMNIPIIIICALKRQWNHKIVCKVFISYIQKIMFYLWIRCIWKTYQKPTNVWIDFPLWCLRAMTYPLTSIVCSAAPSSRR